MSQLTQQLERASEHTKALMALARAKEMEAKRKLKLIRISDKTKILVTDRQIKKGIAERYKELKI